MTATDRAKELLELRKKATPGKWRVTVNRGPYKAENDAFMTCAGNHVEEVCEALLSAEAKVEKYQDRLEITHDYDGHTGEKREIPPEKRDTYPDGIFCRDATIKLLKGEIEDYRAKVAALKETDQ